MRFTNWEKERVPQDVWEKASELKKTAEADPILLDYEKRIIDYVDFTDYIKIFRFKKILFCFSCFVIWSSTPFMLMWSNSCI